jgi:branched-chain amino acid transport system substrate-binding protein
LLESDKVDVIIGGSSTGSAMAIMPFVEKAGVPMISPAPGMGLTDPVRKWVFKTPHGDNLVAQRILIDMKKRGLTKIALLTDTASSGQSGRKEILAAVSKYGISVLADETFAPKDTDMTPQLTKIRGILGLQAIFMYTGAGPGSAIATKNCAQLGMKVPLYLSHANASKEFLRMAGNAAEGARVASGAAGMPEAFPEGHPSRSVCEAFYKDYREAYKVDALPYASNARDALILLVDAIKRAGSTDKDKVRDAIEQTKNFAAMMGIFNYSPTDHAGVDIASLAILEVKEGNFTPVR